MAELIRHHGGEPVLAPAMREVPLSENTAALEFLCALDSGAIDVVVLMTGVGLRTLVATVASQWSRERIAAALGRATLVARGSKSVAALRELGLQPHLIEPEPNTWREVLAVLDAQLALAGKRVAVQEYGVPNQQLLAALDSRGAIVSPVPVYRWALPEDIGPLRAAVHALCAGTIDVAVFTSSAQVDHLLQVADSEGCREPLCAALARLLVASVGPVCSQRLRDHGLPPDIEPVHPKMGQLLADLAKRGPALLRAKRRP